MSSEDDEPRPADERRFVELDTDERLAEFLRLQTEREAREAEKRRRMFERQRASLRRFDQWAAERELIHQADLERAKRELALRDRRSSRRHRPPNALSAKTVRRCEDELAKRRNAGNPTTGPLTLKAIAQRLGWPRPRVKQAEELVEVGWPLLRTHPDFSTPDAFVRWPTPREAAQILRSG